MKIARATLESVTPYSQSKYYSVDQVPKLNDGKELHKDYEMRTWRNRLHVNADGHIFIPPPQFKASISGAAAYNSEKIKGRGAEKYTKHFLSGVQVIKPLVLPDLIDEIPSEDVLCSADGRKGGSTKVLKRFGVIQCWEGVVDFLVGDEIIDEAIFTKYLTEAGQFQGIGRFRTQKGGWYGCYQIVNLEWDAQL